MLKPTRILWQVNRALFSGRDKLQASIGLSLIALGVLGLIVLAFSK